MSKKNEKTKPRIFLRKTAQDGGKLLLYSENPSTKKNASPFVANEIEVPKGIGEGKHVVILGGGVAGLTAAYELLINGNYKVTLLEARERLGGRSLTLRRGDRLTEVIDGQEHHQVCLFKQEENKPAAYLNAGPGRIPSGHKNVLSYCQKLNVELEPYIMESRSNIHHTSQPSEENRRIINDTRGHLAAKLYASIGKSDTEEDILYKSLLRNFGQLDNDGKYILPTKDAKPRRSGYESLPTVLEGTHHPIIPMNKLLRSEYWKRGLYQPEDWLWQQTSFQPVGGMDKIIEAFKREILCLGGTIRTNSPVTKVQKIQNRWLIMSNNSHILADICISNIPIPLLKNIINLEDFSKDYQAALKNVFDPSSKFLAPSTKVGWQAKRSLWQNPEDDNQMPIYGGISRTSLPMNQMWYPSDRIHDELGVLTGAYNFGNDAENWGKMSPEKRLIEAKKNLKELHGADFAEGVEAGVTIAWQNIPYLKGAWPNWANIAKEDNVKRGGNSETYNRFLMGDNGFFTCGDQNSQYPGWQEGAIQSAMNVVCQVVEVKNYFDNVPQATEVPDTNALVQGSFYENEE